MGTTHFYGTIRVKKGQTSKEMSADQTQMISVNQNRPEG